MDDSSSINVGRILGPHGLWGAIRIEVYTDVPHRFDVGNTLYIGAYPYQVSECSTSNAGHVTLSFHGITTQSQARTLIDQWITVPASEVPELPAGEFYHFQLLYLRVLTEELADTVGRKGFQDQRQEGSVRFSQRRFPGTKMDIGHALDEIFM